MADLGEERKQIQVEESTFQFAVSESMIQKIGRAINFINKRQYDSKRFPVNGPYHLTTLPFNGIDGLVIVEFNIEIINAWMYNLVAGTSGTTELDIKRATVSGGAFSSIFSTTPKITSAASANSWVGEGESITGCTAAVRSVTNVDAGDALRCDLLQSMPGAESCGIIIHFRPR